MPEAARSIYDYLSLDVLMNELPREFSQPHQPVILLGLNHEAVIEPIVLISLLNRNDIKFPGMKVFQYLGPNISNYILPLLPKNVATDYCGKTKPTLSNRVDPVYQLYCLEDKSTEEICRLNQSSIRQAAGHISSGGALIIFLGGGRSINCSWYQGISQILSQLPPEIVTSTPIFPISLTGLTRNLIYWKIHKASFNNQEATPIYVNIRAPIFLPSWAACSSPERLLDYVRNETNVRLESPSNPAQLPSRNRFHSELQWG